MKVVLFCGGMGTRIRESAGNLPKPMVKIGDRPILEHIMMYYAYHGHKDFILCLGYQAQEIKKYFLNFDECIASDFTLMNDGKRIVHGDSDLKKWNITFAGTGLNSNIGQRLKAVEKYLSGEEIFLANYADGLTDMPLEPMIEAFMSSGSIASFVCVKPSQSFHVVNLHENSRVLSIDYVRDTDIIINGGYFVFRKEIFNYLRDGEELVNEPFSRLIAEKKLMGYRCDHFWCMDTFKEHQELNDMFNRGNAPWEIWRKGTE